ncbi:hypothetical protein FACS189492_0760 [Clostridia bacterium]|nr:hypothetical protein FACS189492_0760 [Clostridia bacterium]
MKKRILSLFLALSLLFTTGVFALEDEIGGGDGNEPFDTSFLDNYDDRVWDNGVYTTTKVAPDAAKVSAYDRFTKTYFLKNDAPQLGDVLAYDLGEGEMIRRGDYTSNTVPFTMNGFISVPDQQRAPVVVFLHGCHIFEKAADTRYDAGFSYIMKELTAQGYACFSLNVNAMFQMDDGSEPDEFAFLRQLPTEHLRRVIQGNNGENPGFPIDLTGRLDLQNVTLIGHSRNGGYIFDIAQALKELGINVNGLFGFAPASRPVKEDEKFAYADVPTAIVLPALDGDVTTLEGNRIFEELKTEKNRTADTQMQFALGANHAAFNEALLQQDNSYYSRAEYEKKQLEQDFVPITPPSEQRDMFKQYVLDFVRAANGDGRLEGLSLPGKALVSFMNGRDKTLASAADQSAVSASGGATVKNVLGSANNDNTAGYMNFPQQDLDFPIPLYQISWTTAGARAEFPLDNAVNTDGYEALAINWAQDSTDGLNNEQDQSATVVLTDSSGNTAKVSLPRGTAALTWQEGKTINVQDWDGNPTGEKIYSAFTPLSTTRISLGDFVGVDLALLKSVTLAFDGSAQGCIVVRDLELIPEKPHWAAAMLKRWQDKGVIKGYEDGSLRPDHPVTRAEAAKMMCYFLPADFDAPPQGFDDVAQDAWYYGYVNQIAGKGIMLGISGTEFEPSVSLTREMAAALLYRQFQNILPTSAAMGFPDSGAVSDWAAAAVGALSVSGVITGYSDGTFKPQANVTRAEFIAMLDRLERM